jgi:hypothetical protein
MTATYDYDTHWADKIKRDCTKQIMRKYKYKKGNENIKKSSEYNRCILFINILYELIDKCEKEGILFIPDHTCCGTCGHAEAPDVKELKESEDMGFGPYDTYMFFHTQTTDNILEQLMTDTPINFWMSHSSFENNIEEPGKYMYDKIVKKFNDMECIIKYENERTNFEITIPLHDKMWEHIPILHYE